MDVNFEYVNPFDARYDYLMRVEHLGRYYFASDILRDYKKVLDVACACGYGTHVLSKIVEKVYGMDRNSEYLKLAKEKYNSNNIEYKLVDFDNEKINGLYDGVVCFETLEHLKYPEKFLKNLYDVLEYDGTLLLSVPNSIYEKFENGKNKDSFHLHVFNYELIIDMIKNNGFILNKVYGQSYINKIVNKEITNYTITDIESDSKTIGYPNNKELNKSYSYIFVLKKRGMYEGLD